MVHHTLRKRTASFFRHVQAELNSIFKKCSCFSNSVFLNFYIIICNRRNRSVEHPGTAVLEIKKESVRRFFSTWSLVVEFLNYRYGNMFFADSIDTNGTNFALFCHFWKIKKRTFRKDSCTKKDHRHEWLVNSSECLWMSLMYPLFVKYCNMHTI